MPRSPKNPQDEAQKPSTRSASQVARDNIVEALMALAAEKPWAEISISDIAQRGGVSLADFRDLFPSKGAILAAYSKGIDAKVLAADSKDLADEPAKERLFDVLMRRLDAMAPHRAGLQGVMAWARRDPLALAALNQVALNSMRFMLEAAGIDSEGALGSLKLQGLVLAWTKVLDVWFEDDDAGLAATMAALDKQLTRGGQFVARAEDAQRLLAPLHHFAQALFDTQRNFGSRMRQRWSAPGSGTEDSGAGI